MASLIQMEGCCVSWLPSCDCPALHQEGGWARRPQGGGQGETTVETPLQRKSIQPFPGLADPQTDWLSENKYINLSGQYQNELTC